MWVSDLKCHKRAATTCPEGVWTVLLCETDCLTIFSWLISHFDYLSTVFINMLSSNLSLSLSVSLSLSLSIHHFYNINFKNILPVFLLSVFFPLHTQTQKTVPFCARLCTHYAIELVKVYVLKYLSILYAKVFPIMSSNIS